MSSQRINLTTATPSHPGRISTIRLVSQAVTGPPGADGAGVSVALKESGTTRVAVATVIDFDAGFDVTTGGVVSLAVTPQPLDTDLTAIAALTSAADKVPYSTGAGTWALADFTAAGRALVDDATAADQRTTLGLGTAATTASTAYATAAQGATADAALPKALYDAHSILYATTDDTPVALTVGASTIVGRKASGNIVALTGAEAAALLPTASDTASGVVELATTAEVVTGTDTARAVTPAGFAAGLAKQAEFMTIAVGDETTAITTGTAKVTWRMPFAFTLTAVRASLTTASSSGTPTVDINEGGTSVLSTKLTIDANELTSTSAATAAVISDATIADDALMTIDIDTAGTGAAGLKVTLYGTRA